MTADQTKQLRKYIGQGCLIALYIGLQNEKERLTITALLRQNTWMEKQGD